MNDFERTLLRLVEAIERRYDGETAKRRENGLSPLIEEVLTDAKFYLRQGYGPNCPECDLPRGAHLRHCSQNR